VAFNVIPPSFLFYPVRRLRCHGDLLPPTPGFEPTRKWNVDVIAGARLVEAECNVCLVGDVSEGDRPDACDTLGDPKFSTGAPM
jgi:hypothetical protein